MGRPAKQSCNTSLPGVRRLMRNCQHDCVALEPAGASLEFNTTVIVAACAVVTFHNDVRCLKCRINISTHFNKLGNNISPATDFGRSIFYRVKDISDRPQWLIGHFDPAESFVRGRSAGCCDKGDGIRHRLDRAACQQRLIRGKDRCPRIVAPGDVTASQDRNDAWNCFGRACIDTGNASGWPFTPQNASDQWAFLM